MEKKILLAVDDSQHARNAVEYAVRVSSVAKNLTYTLYHVQCPVSQYLVDEAKSSLKARAALDKLLQKNADTSGKMLEKFKELMIDLGIDEKRIGTLTVTRKMGLAKDIIELAQEKRYDAIVAGRRGLGKVQEVLMGSASKNLVEHSRVVPVWVVDGNVSEKTQKIMIAIDGSESSLRAVEHFCFVIGHNPNLFITLFHVATGDYGDHCPVHFDETDTDLREMIVKGAQKCVEKFMAHALNQFSQAGIDKKHLQIKKVNHSSIGKAIIDEIHSGGYGTVVIGRRGINKAFFMGSVSNYVLERASGLALWLVP
jgi:nucleotide-binding universal stress UspA family protein